MTITLTEAAARQIRAQVAKRGNGVGLRVGVKNVGCSGYAYTYDIADAVNDDDRVFEAHGATLVVQARHLASLTGSRFDFVTEGMKQFFKFDNPNVGTTCGCGESFSIRPGAGATP